MEHETVRLIVDAYCAGLGDADGREDEAFDAGVQWARSVLEEAGRIEALYAIDTALGR
jgi:hypothetical protein